MSLFGSEGDYTPSVGSKFVEASRITAANAIEKLQILYDCLGSGKLGLEHQRQSLEIASLWLCNTEVLKASDMEAVKAEISKGLSSASSSIHDSSEELKSIIESIKNDINELNGSVSSLSGSVSSLRGSVSSLSGKLPSFQDLNFIYSAGFSAGPTQLLVTKTTITDINGNSRYIINIDGTIYVTTAISSSVLYKTMFTFGPGAISSNNNRQRGINCSLILGPNYFYPCMAIINERTGFLDWIVDLYLDKYTGGININSYVNINGSILV